MQQQVAHRCDKGRESQVAKKARKASKVQEMCGESTRVQLQAARQSTLAAAVIVVHARVPIRKARLARRVSCKRVMERGAMAGGEGLMGNVRSGEARWAEAGWALEVGATRARPWQPLEALEASRKPWSLSAVLCVVLTKERNTTEVRWRCGGGEG